MSGAPVGVATVSLCSAARVEHLRAQLAALGDSAVSRIVVWVGDDDPPPLDADVILHVPPGEDGLRLAGGRNAGARAAIARGAGLLVFLDADCIPGRALVPRYVAGATAHPGAVLCGPVTYLPPGADTSSMAALEDATAPHPARPSPPDGCFEMAPDADYRLFWSLSFALSPDVWVRSGGFDEAYQGYGGEDTDFAFRMRRERIPLVWVGGAHAYHQHHETSSPPWQHLDDILRNAALFHERWGEWPMTGWIEAFAEAEAIVWDGSMWRRR